MVIIISEDPVYVAWLQRHRDGFVLDTRRKPTSRNTVLHRATCADIRTAKTRRTYWTTGRKMKACSTDVAELMDWACQQTGKEPRACEVCQPLGEPTVENNLLQFPQSTDFHLKGMRGDIVSCVVEVAVIHLDDHTAYTLTMGYIAKYLSKSCAQLTRAMARLINDGYLSLDRAVSPGAPIPANCRVFPTPLALRTVPAFRELGDEAISREISGLYHL